MPLDVYEPIWFRLGSMTDTSELHTLILFYVTLNPIQGKGGMRYKKVCADYFTQLIGDSIGIWFVGGFCSLNEPCSHFISFDQYSRQGTQLR